MQVLRKDGEVSQWRAVSLSPRGMLIGLMYATTRV
jgi:hypothetical protein